MPAQSVAPADQPASMETEVHETQDAQNEDRRSLFGRAADVVHHLKESMWYRSNDQVNQEVEVVSAAPSSVHGEVGDGSRGTDLDTEESEHVTEPDTQEMESDKGTNEGDNNDTVETDNENDDDVSIPENPEELRDMKKQSMSPSRSTTRKKRARSSSSSCSRGRLKRYSEAVGDFIGAVLEKELASKHHKKKKKKDKRR